MKPRALVSLAKRALVKSLVLPVQRARFRRKWLSAAALEVADLGFPERHAWIGYYDVDAFSPDGRFVVAHVWTPGDEQVSFGLFEFATSKFKEIGKTRCWSFQFGVRLQFITDDLVAFHSEEKGLVQTVFFSVSRWDRMEAFARLPLFSISPDRSRFTTLDYAQIYRHRPGYGFVRGIESSADIRILNVRDGSLIGVIDRNRVADRIRDVTWCEPIRGSDVSHLNVPFFDITGTRLAFVLAHFGTRRRQYLIVHDLKTGEYRLCPLWFASHYCWISANTISVFGASLGTLKNRYWIWHLETDSLTDMPGPWPRVDGHQSFHWADPDRWVTDTYPDTAGYQHLFEINTRTRVRTKLGSFFAPLGMSFDKCDLHPRYSKSGQLLAVDSAYSSFRRIVVLSSLRHTTRKRVA